MQLNYKFAKYLGEHAFENRFATQKEAKESLTKFDFTGKKRSNKGGIPLFSDGITGHVDCSDDHSLIIGTTGSMKTRALILPTIISLGLAGENMVILDPKGEIYEKTSGFLNHEGYTVNALNFRDLKHSDCWNPLHEPYHLIHDNPNNVDKINQGKSLVNDLMAIIAGLNEKRGGGKQDPFWLNMGREFVEGITSLLVLASPTESYCHLSNLASLVTASLEPNDEDVPNRFKSFIDNFPDTFSIKQKLGSILGTANTTKGGIVSEGKSLLTPFFSNKEIEFILSQNTINLHDYANSKKKVATFIIIPEEKPTYNFISTIFIKQLYALLIADAEHCSHQCLPKRVNFILDEFANIPKIEDMDNMISAARSRNIRFYLVLQCNSQLHSKYDQQGTTIKNNCQNWVYLNSREKELINEVQELVGVDPSDPQSHAVSVNDLLGIKKDFPTVRCLVVRKDGKPFVTKLMDITMYDYIMRKDDPIHSPLKKETLKQYIRPLTLDDLIEIYADEDARRDLISLDDVENQQLADKLYQEQRKKELKQMSLDEMLQVAEEDK